MNKVYPMGIDLYDLLRYNLLFGGGVTLFFFLVVIVLPAIPVMVMGFVLGGGVVVLLIALCLFVFMIFIIMCITVSFALRAFVHHALIHNRCNNRTELTSTDIIAIKQDGLFHPVVSNRIPRSMVRKIERVDEAYFKERWRLTPWYMKINFLHKHPHGGMYFPFTGKRKLLILYLKDPIMFTNREVSFLTMRGSMLLKTLPVMEVVLDIKESDQGSFFREVMSSQRPD